MRISDWSSDVCSSDLVVSLRLAAQSIDQNKGFGRNTLLDEDIADQHAHNFRAQLLVNPTDALEVLVSANYSKVDDHSSQDVFAGRANSALVPLGVRLGGSFATNPRDVNGNRSEEPTSELQSLMRTSYAVFCLKKQQLQNQLN